MTLALLSSISPSHLLSDFGVAGVFAIMAIEMGVVVAFFLPGDSLLFVAGYATVAHNALHLHLPLASLCFFAALGAVIGGQVGFEAGRRAGRVGASGTSSSRWVRPEYAHRANRFLDRFGLMRAVILSRFVPVVRTFTSPVIGVSGASRTKYAAANLIGGIVWTVPLVLLGHYLGHISFIRKYIEVLAVIIVVVSVVPALYHLMKERRGAAA